MKKILSMFLILIAIHANGQSADTVVFHITITDPASIQSISNTGNTSTPVFASGNINAIIANYHISEFKVAFPDSRFPYLKQVYKVRCNSAALAADLQAANPVLFPHYDLLETPQLLGYYPNDWAIGYYPDYLEFINGPCAWEKTKGDPNVVIGITDTYFDMNNPDLNTKVARIGPNTYTPSGHGTLTAGIIACATDNGIGYPSIGFNCMLDMSNNISDNEMLLMSTRGRRIINGSWTYGSSLDLNLRSRFYEQGIYNEIYENGTLTCIAAGNGKGSNVRADYFGFPASYDHVFSTTNVCWENELSSGTLFNVKRAHEITIGDSTTSYQHNSRVDICAPAIRIGGLQYDPLHPTDYYMWDAAWGTSVASPMTAGTAGLIQSRLKAVRGAAVNFSPYQLEWILKRSANADMLSMYANAPYTGRLGAGRLDACAAVDTAASLDPNDPVTQTMYIKGLEINTICAPGYSSNGVRPRFTPVIVNGVPPYTYVWEKVPGLNNAVLDDENIESPTVMSLDPGTVTPVFYYRLTVYDNSPIAQKVAMKTFKINLRTAGYDLAMRDSYMDMFNESNDQMILDPREKNPYESPDLWNRRNADGITEHQQPEYYISAPNYAYVRVRNIGCTPAPATAKLRLYWTKASTGENWDTDWKYTDVCGGGSVVPGGREITNTAPLNIPALAPGNSTILSKSWFPPNPSTFCDATTRVNACLLARIEESPSAPYGMKIPEITGKDVVTNVWNNNNIVTHNMWITNLNPFDRLSDKTGLIIGNPETTAHLFNFEFTSERSVFPHFAGDFSGIGYVTLYLGSLFNVWMASGGHGNVASVNQQTNSVTFDGATPLHLDSILLAPGQKFTVGVEFTINNPAAIMNASTHTFFARQYKSETPDQLYGGGDYVVNVSPNPQNTANKNAPTGISDVNTAATAFSVSPNPTSGLLRVVYTGKQTGVATITVTDLEGRALGTYLMPLKDAAEKTIDLSSLASGTYLVSISGPDKKTEVHKVVKQ